MLFVNLLDQAPMCYSYVY